MTLLEIKQLIADTLEREFQLDVSDIDFAVSTTSDAKFGDFACNVAMVWARTQSEAPRAVAERWISALEQASADFAKIEVAGPGFINITMTPEYWQKLLNSIDSKFGSSKLGKGRKAQVEFISANPTGPLTLGNARGGFLGDTIANVLSRAGYDVTREYYFNDAGTQIRKLVESVRVAAGLITVDEVQYKGAYINDLADKYKDKLDLSDDALGELLTQDNFETFIKDAIDRMGVHFDVWFNEKSLQTSGEYAASMKLLTERSLTYEKDGATWLKSTGYGDERDRVLVKGSGDVTYLANDIAYHLNILEKRDFDLAIKLWGADHAGQVPSLRLTMKELAPDKELDFVIMQWVRLIKDGHEVKMSKRAGNFVTVQDLLDELEGAVGKSYAVALARFFFLMRSADTAMDFDLDLALEQSSKNPYFYIMYAYARANSILAKAQDKNLTPAISAGNFDDVSLALVKKMAELPELIGVMAEDYGVHRLSFYGLELAKLFQEFYESGRIIDLQAHEAAPKLYLVQKYIIFMDIYWALLGVEPIKHMEQEATL